MFLLKLKYEKKVLLISIFSFLFFFILTQQSRSHKVCPNKNPLNGNWYEACPHSHDPVRDINRELSNFEKTIRSYLNQGLVPPITREYFTYLDRQARYKEIPSKLKRILSTKYSTVNLSSVKYAENINTVHGKAITVGNKIYFPRRVDFNDYSDLYWLLHELEHVSQYQVHGGKEAFLVKYLINGALEIGRNGSIDIHGSINLERDAKNKADAIIAYAWNSLNASPNSPRYAVLCIRNETNLDINYSYRWGNGSWKKSKVSLGGSKWHSYSYDYPGENRSPTFYIDFDYSLRDGQNLRKDYVLDKQAAQDQKCSQGAQYLFKYTNSTRDNIDLYKKK